MPRLVTTSAVVLFSPSRGVKLVVVSTASGWWTICWTKSDLCYRSMNKKNLRSIKAAKDRINRLMNSFSRFYPYIISWKSHVRYMIAIMILRYIKLLNKLNFKRYLNKQNRICLTVSFFIVVWSQLMFHNAIINTYCGEFYAHRVLSYAF